MSERLGATSKGRGELQRHYWVNHFQKEYISTSTGVASGDCTSCSVLHLFFLKLWHCPEQSEREGEWSVQEILRVTLASDASKPTRRVHFGLPRIGRSQSTKPKFRGSRAARRNATQYVSNKVGVFAVEKSIYWNAIDQKYAHNPAWHAI